MEMGSTKNVPLHNEIYLLLKSLSHVKQKRNRSDAQFERLVFERLAEMILLFDKMLKLRR